MAIKFLLTNVIIAVFCSCMPCEQDPHGEELILVVPMSTSPLSDSLKLGDTIWINIHFDKKVKVFNKSNTIRLDSFNFFTEMFISEISGVEEDYFRPLDTIVVEGKLHYLPLPTAVVYPVLYDEHTDYYAFQAGIIPKERGLYWIGLSTSFVVLKEYDHPAMYLCEGNRRDEVRIRYSNSSTNRDNFESMFKQNQVSYLQNVEYEDFASVGSVSLVVY